MMAQGSTYTKRGFIPHLPMRTGDGMEFEAPVKLVVKTSEGGSDTHKVRPGEPMTWRGKYVYALPGGGEILGGVVRDITGLPVQVDEGEDE